MINSENTKKEKIQKIIKFAAAAAAAAAFVALAIYLTPMVMSLRDASVREAVRDKVGSWGLLGVAAMFLLQVLQIVLAILPGEPVELLLGFLYGTFGGLGLCLAGIAIGTTLVFAAAGLLGRRYIKKFVSSGMHKKLAFLRDPVKRDAMFFLLFLIPGTPKDVLTYFAPLTGVNLLRFVVISCIARIPSAISSTYVGANISQGNLAFSALVFIATAVLGIAGILINNRVIEANRAKPGESR
jgi:uncharacterized membrane protein YdjX (TVP38/TMEM64 family)